MLMTHDHPIEYVWLATATFDVWVSLSSWVAAHRDWRRAQAECLSLDAAALRKRVTRDAVTYAIEVSAALNAALALLLLLAATASLFLPPPPPTYMTALQSLVVITVLIVVNMLNAAIAVHGRLTRYRLSTGYFERRSVVRATGSSPASHAISEAYSPPDRKPDR